MFDVGVGEAKCLTYRNSTNTFWDGVILSENLD